MTYEAMCRYIVAKEGYDWEWFCLMRESRERKFFEVRQICFYLGSVFFKNLSLRQLGEVFGKEHATVFRSNSNVCSGSKISPEQKEKIASYQKKLTEMLDAGSPYIFEATTARVLEEMRNIAEAYCRITGKKIV